MKNKAKRPPTRSKLPVLRQLCHLIPPHLVAQLARDLGVEKLARTFSHWSHVVALLYAQLVHAISLNDVCDSLRLHSGPLSALRRRCWAQSKHEAMSSIVVESTM